MYMVIIFLSKYKKFKISKSKYGNYKESDIIRRVNSNSPHTLCSTSLDETDNLLLSSFLRRFRLQEFSSPGGCDCKAICRKQALHGQLSILKKKTYILHKNFKFYKDWSALSHANTAKHVKLVTLVYWPQWKISLILNMVIIP
jgi:hypothetical protein